MDQADCVLSTPPLNTSAITPPALTESDQDTRARNLAAQERRRQRALRRLAKLREKARAEIERLLTFLDASDIDPDLEPTLSLWTPCAAPSRAAEADECEIPDDDEPSLGSFDRMMDQTMSTVVRLVEAEPDAELDDCDREDADPAEESDTGVADLDGLMEQTGETYGRHGARVEG